MNGNYDESLLSLKADEQLKLTGQRYNSPSTTTVQHIAIPE